METRRFFSGVSDFTFPDIRRTLTLGRMLVIISGRGLKNRKVDVNEDVSFSALGKLIFARLRA